MQRYEENAPASKLAQRLPCERLRSNGAAAGYSPLRDKPGFIAEE
jgi:hypothetical protein